MDAKKIALIIGIAVLLPLFLGLFMDAVYTEPKYENYCNNTQYMATPVQYKDSRISNITCPDTYSTSEVQKCYNEKGNPIFKYDSNNCQIYDKCDYCQLSFNNAQQQYNRTLFFILAPIGLLIVILGIYLVSDYLGAGFMFAGLVTMFYATVRYFSEMSKLLRAIVILIELIIIVWIGYRKIDQSKSENKSENNSKTGSEDNSKKKKKQK